MEKAHGGVRGRTQYITRDTATKLGNRWIAGDTTIGMGTPRVMAGRGTSDASPAADLSVVLSLPCA